MRATADQSDAQTFRTLPERITGALRAAIQNGELAGGALLVQDDLAARYGVSRSPVREALRQLQAEGLVTLYPHRGFVVTELTRAEVRELYDMRLPLELRLLELALPQLKRADLDRAGALLDELDTAADGPSWGRLDRAFHHALYAPAGRPRHLTLTETLRDNVNRYQHAYFSLTQYEAECQAEHRALLDRVAAGDGAGAKTVLSQHLEQAADRVMQFLDPRSKPQE